LRNPNKPSKKSKKPASIVAFLVIVSLVLTIFFIGSLTFFVDVWQKQAFKIDRKTQTEVQLQNGNATIINNSTLIVENYFPFRNHTAYPIIYKINSTNIGSINFTETNLKEQNIKIDSYEIKRAYGDKELYPPYKVINSTAFPIVEAIGMTKTTLIINWRYNKTEPEAGQEEYSVGLLYTGSPNATIRLISREEGLNKEILNTFWGAIPYLFFVASGFAFSWYAFGKGKLTKDYSILSKFPKIYQDSASTDKKEMETSLGNIVAFPKKVGRGWRLMFGLSIFVVKALVNNSCKEHDESIGSYKIAPFRRKSLSKIFSKYKKQTFEKIEDTLPELKTILIITAFLASVGISFSFNVGAAGAFVYSLALFYFFFNLGSIFQFVIKSNKDRIWMIVAIFAAIVAVIFPEIISILRRAA
jgi:hypothetical protein